MDLNSQSVDPLQYPSRFYFFSSVLSEYPIFSYISQIIVIFSYIQSFFVSFIPILVLTENKDSFKELKDTLVVFLSFSTNSFINYDNYIIYNPIITVVIMVCSIIIGYLEYKILNSTSSIYFKMRGLLFLFVPNCFFDQLAIILGIIIRRVIFGKDTFMHSIVLVVEILSSLLLLKFTFFISPLIMKNPLFSCAHIPTPLFPNYDFIIHGIIDFIFIFLCILFNSKMMTIFIYVFYMLYAIYHIYKLYKVPYMSHIDTTLSVVTDICHIFLVPISIAILKFDKQRAFLLSSIAFALVLMIIVHYYLENKGKKIISSIDVDDFYEMDDDKVIYCIQETILHNAITKTTLSIVDQALENTSRLDAIAIRLYVRLLVGDQNYQENEPTTMYLNLMNSTGISTCQKYFIFELLSAHSKYDNNYSFCNCFKIVEMFNDYENTSAVFWENMMKGKTKSAFLNVEELNKQSRRILECFEEFHLFYPHNQYIQQLEDNFISNIAPDYFTLNYKYDEDISKTKLKCAQFIEASTKTVVSLVFGRKKSSEDFCGTYNEYNIKSRISKHVVKGFTCKTIIAEIFFVLSILILFGLNMSYTAIIAVKSQSMDDFFYIGKDTIDLFSAWTKVTLAIDLAINETGDGPLSCSSLMEQIGIPEVCRSSPAYIGYFKNINNSAFTVLNNMRKFFESNDYLTKSKSLLELRKIMVEPIIKYFPFISELDNITFDARTLMIYYSTYVVEHLNLTNGVRFEDSDFIQYFRERYLKFSSITHAIFNQLRKMNKCLHNYSLKEISHHSVKESLKIVLVGLIVVFSVLVPVSLYIFNYELIQEVVNDLNNHFRMHIHPSLSEDIKYQNVVEKFSINSLTKFSFHTFVFCIIYSLICIGIWFLTQSEYSKIWEVSNSILYVHRFSISASATLGSCLTSWQLSDLNNSQFREEAIETSTQLFVDQIKSIYNAADNIFDSKDLYNITHSHCTSYNSSYFHDFYDCWGIQYIHMLLSFYAKQYASKGDFDSLTVLFAHIEHIVLEHSIPLLDLMIDKMEKMLYKKANESNFVLCLMLCFNFIAFILGIVFVCQRIFYFISIKYQLGRLIMDLDPLYIASNQDLVEYIIGKPQKFLEWTKESPIFDILNTSKTPLLVISDKYSILAFTDKVPQLFNYRPEQLIGQHYTMLFKKKNETLTTAQESFFQIVTDLLTQNIGSTSRTINGISSDGSYIRLDVNVNVITYNNTRKCIILELISLMDSVQIEEATIIFQDVIKNIIEKSTPISLFPVDNSDSEYVTRRFYSSVLVFTAIKKDTMVRGQTDFAKTPLKKTLPLLSGENNAIVIANTGTYALIIFTDSNNSGKKLENAVNFIKDYATDCEKGTTQYSIMIDIAPFEAVQFLPPELSSEFDGVKITSDALNRYSPAMTTDPFIPILNEIGDLISIMRADMVFVSDSIAEKLDQNCQLLPVTLINSKRQMYATKLCSLKLK